MSFDVTVRYVPYYKRHSMDGQIDVDYLIRIERAKKKTKQNKTRGVLNIRYFALVIYHSSLNELYMQSKTNKEK